MTLTKCKICEQYKQGKRKVCIDCKIEFPFISNCRNTTGGYGGDPFNRKERYLFKLNNPKKKFKRL